jgi:hypothetical protein
MNGIATNFFPAMPFFSEAAEAYSDARGLAQNALAGHRHSRLKGRSHGPGCRLTQPFFCKPAADRR